MNFQEILDKFKELEISKSDFAYEDLDKNIFGEVKTVNRKGGEGKGESWNIVKHFLEGNIYISLDGFYTSYDGTDFSEYEFEEVIPKGMVITVYTSK